MDARARGGATGGTRSCVTESEKIISSTTRIHKKTRQTTFQRFCHLHARPYCEPADVLDRKLRTITLISSRLATFDREGGEVARHRATDHGHSDGNDQMNCERVALVVDTTSADEKEPEGEPGPNTVSPSVLKHATDPEHSPPVTPTQKRVRFAENTLGNDGPRSPSSPSKRPMRHRPLVRYRSQGKWCSVVRGHHFYVWAHKKGGDEKERLRVYKKHAALCPICKLTMETNYRKERERREVAEALVHFVRAVNDAHVDQRFSSSVH